MDSPQWQDVPRADSASAPGKSGADPPATQGDELFRRVVEWAPFAMVMIDAHGRIVLVNAQSERVFGYRREELVGQLVEMLVPERFSAQHPTFRDSFRNDPTPRPMGIGRDLFARRRDGSEFPVEIGLNPIDTAHGSMVLASIVDITERHRAQQSLEGALNEKTVLLNEVHHRVKNNLQVICSLLNMQASAIDDKRVHEVLKEVEHRVRAMALTHQLIYEHKDFAHIDLGEYLQRLAQLLLNSYRGSARRVSVRSVLPETPVTLDLDRAIPCALIVNELVTNAFKHGFPDERAGEIVIALTLAEDDLIEMTVADNGVGMLPGFDIDESRSLGLQLVTLLTSQLHGTLDIGKPPGGRFSLRFARRRETRNEP